MMKMFAASPQGYALLLENSHSGQLESAASRSLAPIITGENCRGLPLCTFVSFVVNELYLAQPSRFSEDQNSAD
jgi:hypothetical protein